MQDSRGEGGPAPGAPAVKDWETVFHAIGHPVVILDPERRVIAANRAASRLLALPPERILGRRCFEVFHGPGSTGPAAGCPLDALFATGEPQTAEMEVEALGGTFPDAEIRRAGMSARGIDCLPKPFTRDQLARRIDKALNP